jgi:hypothetical protein
LKKVNPQHAFEIDRRPATIACRIVRPNDVAELRPGQDTIHLIEKLRSARRLGVAIKVRTFANDICSSAIVISVPDFRR